MAGGWEHTYRFCKQTLNWTTPRVRTPQQADRWTWLVTLAYTQLRLARRAIEDVHLPWEHDQRPNRRVLTAARVRQAFPQLLVTLDTAGEPTKTLRPLTGTPQRRTVRPSTTLPGLQESRLTSSPHLLITKPATHPMAGQPVLVKSQAENRQR
jgi:hypothetical protein